MTRPVERFFSAETLHPLRGRGRPRVVCVAVACVLAFLASAGIGAPDPWGVFATIGFVIAFVLAAFFVRWA